MKPLLFSLLFFITVTAKAQQQIGVNFENDLRWGQIKEKAKKENKYIFLDVYTTWCGPCKQMSKDIFPQQKVGDFFNQKFINVAVQLDVTKNDDKNTRAWYEDAKAISKTYKIDSYPTYLFFNPAGILVHVIKGSILNPDEFIAKANEALDPEKQLFSLKKEYDLGKRSDDFLLTLINSADKAGDPNLPDYVNEYLTRQKDLLTPHNFSIAALGVTGKDDLAYQMILNNPAKANAALGKEKRIQILNQIIFENEIFPLLRINGKIEKTRFMITYTGEINKSVNWQDIENALKIKYGDIAGFIYTDAKLTYFRWTKDWVSFNSTMDTYTVMEKDVNFDYVSKMVSYLIAFSDHKKDALAALGWAKVLLNNEKISYYKKDYSRLLYKAEKRDEAIVLMQNYINTKGVNDQAALENIEKMKKGEEFYW